MSNDDNLLQKGRPLIMRLHQDAVPVPPNPASIAEFEPLGTLFALTRYLPTFKISHNANRLWFPHSLR